VGCLIFANSLGTFEALGQKMDQRRIDIVDAVAKPLKFSRHHGPALL
jgi:hypothetical protein